MNDEEKKPRFCFSKWVVIATGANALFWSFLTVFAHFFTEKDPTAIATIAGLAWGVFGTAIGFYYTKAKQENKIKLTQGMIDKWAKDYGSDFIAQIVGTIFID